VERDIKKHCVERLASYKVPHLIEFRDALPRNPSGKVLKNELK
jgi:acyl-CoA synthetase (AMP-forming)/AMP-acid ligase II